MKKLLATIISGVIFNLSVVSPASSSDAFISFYTPHKYLNHINKGYIAYDLKNYPLALKEFLTAKKFNDNLFAAHEGLAMVYEATKNQKEALESYQKALTLISPSYASDLTNQIKYYRKSQNYKSAISIYKRILSIRPEAGLQMLYGDNYFKQGQLGKALISYKRAYQLQEEPDGYLKYLRVKNPNKEYERFVVRKYIEKNTGYPEAHYKSGLVAFNLKNYYLAIQEFEKATEQITSFSTQKDYLFYLAKASYEYAIFFKNPKKEYLEKSIENFEKYLRYSPENVNAMLNLAEAYFYNDVAKMNSFNKEHEIAEREFNRVADLPSSDPEYIDSKATLNAVLNKKYNTKMFERSISVLDDALSVSSNPKIHYQLGNVYFKKGLNHYKGFYERYRYLNNEKANAGRQTWEYYQKALDEYKNYLTKKPSDYSVYYDIGIVYYNCSKLEPDVNNLPINSKNRNQYKTWGPKFFKVDMINRATDNMKVFYSRSGNTEKRRLAGNMIKEMELSKITKW